jgi:hypothetical protein
MPKTFKIPYWVELEAYVEPGFWAYWKSGVLESWAKMPLEFQMVYQRALLVHLWAFVQPVVAGVERPS